MWISYAGALFLYLGAGLAVQGLYPSRNNFLDNPFGTKRKLSEEEKDQKVTIS